MTEAAALQELKKGSEKALEWFIVSYTPYVMTIICNIIGDYMPLSDAEEVASDVFLALWENRGKVTSPKGYLGTVARNKAKNKCRERGYDLPLEEQILVLEGRDLEGQLQRKECHLAVRQAVVNMPEPEREIFLRHYFYFQKVGTISQEMDMPLSTVKTKLRRGRDSLRIVLESYIKGG